MYTWAHLKEKLGDQLVNHVHLQLTPCTFLACLHNVQLYKFSKWKPWQWLLPVPQEDRCPTGWHAQKELGCPTRWQRSDSLTLHHVSLCTMSQLTCFKLWWSYKERQHTYFPFLSFVTKTKSKQSTKHHPTSHPATQMSWSSIMAKSCCWQIRSELRFLYRSTKANAS